MKWYNHEFFFTEELGADANDLGELHDANAAAVMDEFINIFENE